MTRTVSVPAWARFTRRSRCPKCGGCADDPRKAERRCTGFWLTSKPGEKPTVFVCTRIAEGSIKTVATAAGEGFVHRLDLSRTSSAPSPQPASAKGKTIFPTEWAVINYWERNPSWKFLKAWAYHRRDGSEHFKELRFSVPQNEKGKAKEYRPIHPVPGGWANGDPPVSGGKLSLYYLHMLDVSQRIFVTEGPKCADAVLSLGLQATTSAHGARAAMKSDWSLLAGCDVQILPDNDKDGEHYATEVAGILSELVPPARVRIVRLPDLPEGGDVVDWMERLDCREPEALRVALLELAEAAPAWTTATSEDASASGDGETAGAELRNSGTSAFRLSYITRKLLTLSGGWPRRVGQLLFTDEDGQVRYLKNVDDLFAWFHDKFSLSWAGGRDKHGRSRVTRGEFFAHLQVCCENFAAVEELPHEPPLPGHYYLWRAPKGVATGEHLRELLSFFYNFETEHDRAFIRAAFLTPGWGGLSGQRPLFGIMAPDRGYGKSTLAAAIGQVYGGHVELSPSAHGEDRLVSRLLTPEALSLRVVRLDNVKGPVSSELIEGLITVPAISGHRLYCGESRRPNTLTYFLTGNGVRASRDLAERSFIIRLKKPERRSGWDEKLRRFIDKHKDNILADIVAQLRRPVVAREADDRWSLWVNEVLARCTEDVVGALALNRERRGECDLEREDADLIMEVIDRYVDEQERLKASASTEAGDGEAGRFGQHAFLSATTMTEVLGRGLGERLSAKAVNARVAAHIDAGRLPRVTVRRESFAKGYLVVSRAAQAER